MKIHRPQSGFTGPVAILLIVVLAVAGFAAWRVMSNDTDRKDSAETSVAENSEEPADTLTYTSRSDGLKFDYPKDWETEPTTEEVDGKTYDFVTLTSPNGAQVKWDSYVDGIGGGCDIETEGSVVITDIEKVDGLDDTYYVASQSNGGDYHSLALIKKDGLDNGPKLGETGNCILFPFFDIKTGTKVGALRATKFDHKDKDEVAAIKAILLSARY